MAIQILPQEQGIGSLLGQGLGSGLSSGLQGLAQLKLQDIANRQQQMVKDVQKSQIRASLKASNLPQEWADLPESTMNTLLKYGGAALGQNAQQQPTLEQTMQGLSPSQFAQTMQGVQASAPGEVTPEGIAAAAIQPKTVGDLWRAGQLQSPEMRQQKELAEQKLYQTEKLATRKMVQKGVEQAIESGEQARQRLETLQEMREKTLSGKLDDPLYLSGLERLGLDIDALKSTDTQVYQAAEKTFLEDLKGVFGGRITDAEMKQFLRSIPKATNTPEARLEIIDKMEKLYRGKQLRTEELQRLMEENKGEVPHNWKALVEKRIKPQLDEIAKEFKAKKANTIDSLDDLSKLPEGKQVEDDEGVRYMMKNGITYKKPVGGGWSKVK